MNAIKIFNKLLLPLEKMMKHQTIDSLNQ